MLYDPEKFRRAFNDKQTNYFKTMYKLDEEFEADAHVAEWILSKPKNTYLKYMNGVFEEKKEVAKKMNKIRRVNDPRMNFNTGNIYAVVNGKAYIPETITTSISSRENMEIEFHITKDPRYAVQNTMLSIKNVIFNPPATIVFWGDGSKTVVKCQDGEEFDPEKGLTMAFFKRMHDNKGRYFEEIKKWVGKYYEQNPTTHEGVHIDIYADSWADIFAKLREASKIVGIGKDEG